MDFIHFFPWLVLKATPQNKRESKNQPHKLASLVGPIKVYK